MADMTWQEAFGELRRLLPEPGREFVIRPFGYSTDQGMTTDHTIEVYPGPLSANKPDYYVFALGRIENAMNELRADMATNLCEYCGVSLDGEVCDNPLCEINFPEAA